MENVSPSELPRMATRAGSTPGWCWANSTQAARSGSSSRPNDMSVPSLMSWARIAVIVVVATREDEVADVRTRLGQLGVTSTTVAAPSDGRRLVLARVVLGVAV